MTTYYSVQCSKCNRHSKQRHCKSTYCGWYICGYCASGLPKSHIVFEPKSKRFFERVQ